ncbi:arabinogalactan O-methyltransferase 1-like [Alnus glutinosa]|uniref:arabinogalactan O-methyltransferase 1-like n=1 Tax=Alnus glutinosa TaxID=3517 RepID=UPI002D768DFE|nr:arabinogalactan O-methyltransferase 1-like [Alnus glutinosa]
MRDMKNNRRFIPEKARLLAVLAAGAITSALLVIGLGRTTNGNNGNSFFCALTSLRSTRVESTADFATTPTQLIAILHYATSRVVPQQSLAEIKVSFGVLQSLAPCNFLVFGLGHDSLMWASLNPRGTTLFLEEDPKWVQTIIQRAPVLRASTVRYRTRLSQADDLLSSYRSEPDCSPSNLRLRNTRCRLALTELPDEVQGEEWDMIMIDAPRGYFPEAPGRMAAIYSAAVMARARTRPGVTHVFLHDVNRRVERVYAKEFLCMKYKVNGVGRLWHFQIPPASNMTINNTGSFC